MLRPVLLTGFMATGKSTVGARVAQLAGRRFVDLDAEIAASAGKSIAQIFAAEGEAHFRTLERAAVERALAANDAPVVALGGGALQSRELRLRALEQAVVVSLQASPAQIAARAQQAGVSRPLLAGVNAEETISILLEQRKLAYAEAHARISTDTLSVEAVAQQVLDLWRQDPIAVAAGAASYSVFIGSTLEQQGLAHRLRGVSQVVLISDHTVFALHGAPVQKAIEQLGKRCLCITLPPGEQHKNPQTLFSIWQQCLSGGADRKSLFFGLGGGVVTDIAGFAAATWMRGARWVGAPTTLLSMVDASVGGKTAVDLGEAKNAVGAFWQPEAVYCDITRLSTEPERGYKSALSEVVKTALIGDPALLELLERRTDAVLARAPDALEEIVRRSITVKARVVSLDERESGVRASLNLGHTLGHAMEAHGGYGRLTHGEAISLGLVAALRIGQQLNVTPQELITRVESLLKRLGLPVDPKAFDVAAAAQLVGHDKKRSGGRVRFVLTPEPGKIVFRDLSVPEIQEFSKQL
ncbi:MAG TPA: 3-dehydroquinate synthase [Polyangiaceae bacterium]|nr:3-dehydroquinate synthase [Polyangiaceae bacterium]